MRRPSLTLAAALVAAAAALPAAPLPATRRTVAPVPTWRRNKPDPLAAERERHNAEVDKRKAERTARRADRKNTNH